MVINYSFGLISLLPHGVLGSFREPHVLGSRHFVSEKGTRWRRTMPNKKKAISKKEREGDGSKWNRESYVREITLAQLAEAMTPMTRLTGKKYAKECPHGSMQVRRSHHAILKRWIIGMENHLEWCWARPQEWVKVAHDFFCRQLLKMVPSRLLEKALEGMRRLQATSVEICPRVTLQSIRKLDHIPPNLKNECTL